MPVHRDNIVEVVYNAWNHAKQDVADSGNKRDDNIQRSKKWLCYLAGQFKEQYTGDRHRLFWRENESNKKHFRTNEFLFDLMVCSVSTTESLQLHSNPLEFIAECHWQIESEFNRGDTRAIVIDLSKLVAGSAENKLFIASHRAGDNSAILEQCSEIASHCSGQMYFSFVSHPDDWVADRKDPAVYEWIAGGWNKLVHHTGIQHNTNGTNLP